MDKYKVHVTKYGEFIPTYYKWVTLDKQKEIVEKLEDITNKKED